MSAPRQMTDRTLNALKGWPSQSAVDYVAEFATTIPSNQFPVSAGSVVSLNPSGQYILGVGNTNVMPLFLFSNSDDPSVSNDGGDASTAVGGWVPIFPSGSAAASGGALALVACGAYELVSTAFVVGQSYAPNTPLTANLSNAADPGKLRPGTIGTNMIVGLVSRGVVNNGYGKNAVAFWPCPIFPGA